MRVRSVAIAALLASASATPARAARALTLAQAGVPVFSGFSVEANVGWKQRLEDVAKASARDARRATALAVARAHWAVRRLTILRDVNAAAIERLRDAEAVADSRVKAGLAP